MSSVWSLIGVFCAGYLLGGGLTLFIMSKLEVPEIEHIDNPDEVRTIKEPRYYRDVDNGNVVYLRERK